VTAATRAELRGLAAAVLAPLVALVVTSWGHTLAWRDTGMLFAPVRTLVGSALRSGALPLWNPHEALGMPLLAQWLHGALHPVSLLAAALGGSSEAELMIWACALLAAAGAYVLARGLGASPAASALAGAAFGGSGYVLGMSAVLQYLIAASSGPWTVAGLLLCARRPAAGVLLGSAAVAAQALAGDPQWALLSVLLGLALALSAGGHAALLRAALAAGLGVLLAAVQLLPALAFLGETSRHLGLTPAEQLQWALQPARLLELGLPGVLAGRPGAAIAPLWASLEGTGARVPFVPSVHVGAVVLVLAAVGARAGRPGRLLALAAVAFAWLALGHHLGARQLLGGLPIWGGIRYAEKLVGPLSLALALLAALGADRLRDAGSRASSARLLTGLGSALLVLAAGALAARLLADPAGLAALAAARAAVALALSGASCLAGGVAATLLLRRGQHTWLPAALAATVIVTSTAAAAFALRAGSPGVSSSPLLPAGRATAEGLRYASLADVALTDPAADEWDRVAAVQSRAGAPSYNVAGRLDQLSAYTGLNPLRFMTVMEGSAVELGPEKWAFWRRYAISHVTVSDALAPAVNAESRAAVDGGVPVARDERLGVTLHAVPHRPWASFAPSALGAADASEAVHLAIAAWSRGDPAVAAEGFSAPALSPGEVLRTVRRTDSLELEAWSTGPALLVVNDAFWPGWEARLDGAPVPIIPVDGLVRGVSWPAGRHVLTMRYAPPEVDRGLAVSGLALLLWAGLAVRAGLRLRRSSAPA